MAVKEAVVDSTDHENNKIDHDTVANRVEKISEQIRQLRHQRDELAFMLDLDDEAPDDSHLTEIRDRIIEIIETGTYRSARRCAKRCSPSRVSTTASPPPPVIRIR